MALSSRHHQLVRFCSLLVLAASVTYMGSRSRVHADITEEGLSQITPATQELIESISTERPVTVHAFVSKDVPREYVTVRSRLMNILREMEASGGPGLQVRIVEPELHSPEAEAAMENFGIMPRKLADASGDRIESMDVFMGLAFVSGPREETVQFLDRGLSPEYEIARALRVVTQEKKKVVGVLRTDATLMGNFDLQARRQQPAWRIVDELRKQYEVRSLNPKADIPEDVDVLFVPQVASLAQGELDTVRKYIDAGRPALLTVDPMPLWDMRLSPKEEKLPPPGQQNQMFGGGAPPGEPKGDYKGLLRDVGIDWPDEQIVFDTHNPNPLFGSVPPYIVFVGERPDGTNPFGGEDPVTSGLSQVVVMFAGELKPAAGYQDKFEPLLSTGKSAATSNYEEMVQRHPLFGVAGPVMPRNRPPVTGEPIVMAARVRGGGTEGEGGHKDRNLIVVSDLDMFGDGFYEMYERGGDTDGDGVDDFRFDNITFLLNSIDQLAGDDRFIDLRKRRATHRRLSEVDQLTKDANEQRQKSIDEANAKAETGLEEAKKSLEATVKRIQEQEGLDETTKAIMLKSAEETENRRLEAMTQKIEREQERVIAKINTQHRRAIDDVQNRIRLLSVLLPPIPALLMGFVIFARKRRRERETIPSSRRAGGAPTPTSASAGKGGEA